MQSPSAPTFNAQQATRDQTSSNFQTAAANSYLSAQNQYTPWGNLIYKEVGQRQLGDGHGGFNQLPEWQVTTELSPQQQKILDQTQGLQTQGLGLASNALTGVGQMINTPLDFSGMPAAPTFSAPADQTKFKDDAYNALMARQNQQYGLQDQALQTQLANQGINPGTDAWKNAYIPLNQSRVDASNQSLLGATSLAGQNIGQALSIDSQHYNEGMGARQQALNEYMAKRNQPLMDYQALLGLSSGVQQPQWAQPAGGQVAPTDTMGPALAQYQGQMQQYQQGVGANNAMMGGLFGLGGSILGGLAGGPMGASLGGMMGRGAARAAGSGTQF